MDSIFFHPKVVHLPIALGVLMPLLAGGLLLAWWREWLPSRAWILAVLFQALLVGSGVVAIRSGGAAEEQAERVVPERFIEAHEEAAETFVWAGAGVLVVMLAGLALSRKRGVALPTAALATLGTLVVLALGYQVGQLGGELVYEHGAASAYVGQPGASTLPAADSRNLDDDDD